MSLFPRAPLVFIYRNVIMLSMYLKVFVTPEARREQVAEQAEYLVIAVKEPARGNHANVRVREIVAERFAVPLWKVAILSGHRSRGKMLVINS